METYFIGADGQGRDFFSPTVSFAADLAAGRESVSVREYRVRNSEHLSVSTTPARITALTWPFRIFEVEAFEPRETPYFVEHVGDMICQRLRVVDELPAAAALGPQSEQIGAVLDRARLVTRDEAGRIAELLPSWMTAWSGRAGQAARDAGRRIWFVHMSQLGPTPAVHRAAAEAAQALLARDLLTDTPAWNRGHYDEATRPWRSVIGPIHSEDGD